MLDREFILNEIECFINSNCNDYIHCNKCPVGEYSCSMKDIQELNVIDLICIYYKITKERSSIGAKY